MWIDRRVPKRQWKKMKWNDECRLNVIRTLIYLYPTLVILCVFLHNCTLLCKNIIPIIINHVRDFQSIYQNGLSNSLVLNFPIQNWALRISWDQLFGYFTKILSRDSSYKKTLYKYLRRLFQFLSARIVLANHPVFHYLIGRSITDRAAECKIYGKIENRTGQGVI